MKLSYRLSPNSFTGFSFITIDPKSSVNCTSAIEEEEFSRWGASKADYFKDVPKSDLIRVIEEVFSGMDLFSELDRRTLAVYIS